MIEHVSIPMNPDFRRQKIVRLKPWESGISFFKYALERIAKPICQTVFCKDFTQITPLCLLLLAAGCAHDTVAPQLVSYVNQDILHISSLEHKAFTAYLSVTDKNYTSEKAVYEMLKNEVIPTYSRYLHLLKKVESSSDEISQLHQTYIRGAELIDRGFKNKLLGIEKKDIGLIHIANDELNRGEKITEKWRKNLEEMRKQHKLRSLKK